MPHTEDICPVVICFHFTIFVVLGTTTTATLEVTTEL